MLKKPPPYPLAGSRQFRSLPPEYRWREKRTRDLHLWAMTSGAPREGEEGI